MYYFLKYNEDNNFNDYNLIIELYSYVHENNVKNNKKAFKGKNKKLHTMLYKIHIH